MTKYEAYYLMLCSGSSQYAVVGGLDPEVVCGRWDAPSRRGGATRTGEGPSHLCASACALLGMTVDAQSCLAARHIEILSSSFFLPRIFPPKNFWSEICFGGTRKFDPFEGLV